VSTFSCMTLTWAPRCPNSVKARLITGSVRHEDRVNPYRGQRDGKWRLSGVWQWCFRRWIGRGSERVAHCQGHGSDHVLISTPVAISAYRYVELGPGPPEVNWLGPVLRPPERLGCRPSWRLSPREPGAQSSAAARASPGRGACILHESPRSVRYQSQDLPIP